MSNINILKKVNQIILNNEVKAFLQAAVTNDKETIGNILSQQRDASLLLYGFEVSHKFSVPYDVTMYSSTDITKEYKINLLEVLSSNPRFYPILQKSFDNPLIVDSLISETNNSPKTDTFLTMKALIQNEIKNKDLWEKVGQSNIKIRKFWRDVFEENKSKNKNKTPKPNF